MSQRIDFFFAQRNHNKMVLEYIIYDKENKKNRFGRGVNFPSKYWLSPLESYS